MHVRHKQAMDFGGMKRLVVVGNGFDIHHGMKSSYANFREWLRENDGDPEEGCDCLLATLGRYFPGSVDDEKEWWNEFEKNLSTLSPQEIVADAVEENQPNFASDDFRDSDYHAAEGEVERVIDGLYDRILEKFTEWVGEIEGEYDKTRRFDWQWAPTDGYVNFNYTDTLERLYGVPAERVLHIHGRPGGKEPLVLGHDGDLTYVEGELEEVRHQELQDDWSEEEYAEWCQEQEELGDDYITLQAKGSARQAVLNHRKPVEEIIESLRLFFGSCAGVEEIVVMGLSYSDVDMPYLKRIAEMAQNARFVLTYFSDGDKQRATAFAGTLAPTQQAEIKDIRTMPLAQPPLPGF